MLDGLVSDFGSLKCHSLCVRVCVMCVGSCPGYTGNKIYRTKKPAATGSKRSTCAVIGFHQSFFAWLNGYLSEWDIRYTTDHSQWQRVGTVPWFLSSPLAKVLSL